MRMITRPRPGVKPTRHTAKPPRPFGEGILPSRPVDALPCTLEDLRWAAEAFGELTPDYDVLALESAAVGSLELGLIPGDLAETLSRTSIVGLADEILHEGADPRASAH